MKPESVRTILRAAITSKLILSRLYASVPLSLFESNYQRKVMNWCYDYYKEYKDAPGEHIRDYLTFTMDEDKEDAQLVKALIEAVANSPEIENEELLISFCEEELNKEYLNQQVTKVKTCLNLGSDKAFSELSNTKKINLSFDSGSKITIDSFIEVFKEESNEDLIDLEGDYADFLRPQNNREVFLSFLAPAKTGKSFFILDLVRKALESGRKVAYFEVGDMSKREILKRMASAISGQPVKNTSALQIPSVLIPKMSIKGPTVDVSFTTRQTRPLTEENIRESILSHNTKCPKFSMDNLQLSVHPNDSVSVYDLRVMLDNYIDSGFMPDVVAIDYADILVDGGCSSSEDRGKINKLWKQLRAISQEYKIMLVTATQADSKSYEGGLLGKDNFSETRTKNDHVTGMIGISKTPYEDRKGIAKLNWVDLRNDSYNSDDFLAVAGNLDIARPVITSAFIDSMELREKFKNEGFK